MKYIDKIKIGFKIAQNSLNIAMKVKGVFWLSIFSFFSGLVCLSCILLSSAYFLGGVDALMQAIQDPENARIYFNFGSTALYVTLFISAYLLQVCTVFFAVAHLACVKEHLEGKASSATLGLKVASSKIKLILGWSFVVFIVSHVISIISNIVAKYTKFDLVEKISQYLIGFAWGLATFFVVPSILFNKDMSLIDSMKESGRIMKEKFLENISAQTYFNTMWAAVMIGTIFIAAIMFCGFLFSANSLGASGSFKLYLAIASILSLFVVMFGFSVVCSIAQTVLKTSLFYYAKNNKLPEEYDPSLEPYMIENA